MNGWRRKRETCLKVSAIWRRPVWPSGFTEDTIRWSYADVWSQGPSTAAPARSNTAIVEGSGIAAAIAAASPEPAARPQSSSTRSSSDWRQLSAALEAASATRQRHSASERSPGRSARQPRPGRPPRPLADLYRERRPCLNDLAQERVDRPIPNCTGIRSAMLGITGIPGDFGVGRILFSPLGDPTFLGIVVGMHLACCERTWRREGAIF